MPLYMACIDMVNRQAFWRLLLKVGCSEKSVRVLRLLHDKMSARGLGRSGSEKELFTVEAGVKQGCVIALTIFSIYISCIL